MCTKVREKLFKLGILKLHAVRWYTEKTFSQNIFQWIGTFNNFSSRIKYHYLIFLNRQEILHAIENILQQVTTSISRQEAPCLSYSRRDAWDNVE